MAAADSAQLKGAAPDSASGSGDPAASGSGVDESGSDEAALLYTPQEILSLCRDNLENYSNRLFFIPRFLKDGGKGKLYTEKRRGRDT